MNIIKTTIVASLLAVASLAANAATGPHDHLTWTAGANTPSTAAFHVYRTTQVSGACQAFSTTSWTAIDGGGISLGTPTFDDYSIAASTTYCYAVTAYNTTNGAQESGPSNILTLTTGSGTTTMPVPNGLSGSYSAQ